MKKLHFKSNRFGLLFLAALFSITNTNNIQAQNCKQVEILYTAPDCFERPPQNPGAGGGPGCVEIAVCVDQPYTYTSSIIAAGWTFSWSVTGPTSVTINPNSTSPSVSISWPSVGIYTLTLTATDPSGNIFTYCLKVNVKDKPIANFSFSPNNVCAGSTISFTNLTTFSGGGVAYSWNFGDPPSGSNNFSTATDPTHTYNTAGTFTVTLIAYSFTMSGGGSPNNPPSIKTCCADTITKQVTIKPGNIKIDCVGTVCAGDTVTYKLTGCGSPTWGPIVGGTILSSAGNTITIIWGNGNPQGQIVATCPGGCTASVPVPIVPTNPIIVGNINPCNNAMTSYTLPVLPGTFYTWTLTNTTTSTNFTNLISTFPDNNVAWINWANATAGTYVLQVFLENKHICCSSTGILTINPLGKWTAFADQTICAGSAASLSVAPSIPGSFSWTALPPNGGVSPLTGSGPSFGPIFSNPGSYLVQVTETANAYCNSGPSNPQQIKVTVVNSPPAGIIMGPITVCPGSQYTYTMNPVAPNGYHYSWQITGGTGSFLPGNPPNPTGDSVNIQWVTLPGQITVVLQRNSFPKCPSSPVVLNVNQATVGTISGLTNVCVDDLVNYSLSGSTLPPAEPVNWTITPGSQGTVMTGQGTSSVTILWHGQPSSGPWSATITATTACGSTSFGPVTIHPKFTFNIIKSGINICNGGVTLTVSGEPSGSTYLWSNSATTNSITVTTGGTYTVTVTKGGCSFSKPIFVEDPFSLLPATCGAGTCNGANTNEQLGVIAQPTGGSFTYQWYSGVHPTGSLISGATSANYLAPNSGPYYVVVTYGTCTKFLPFTVKKICCPDVNTPVISFVRNSCNTYTFTGTTPNPSGASITWNFGDGSTAAGVSGVPIAHTYTTAGVFCVTFCVGPPSPNLTNCTGNCAVRQVVVPVQASFFNTMGCNGCVTVFNTSTVLLSPANVSYFWNFGDGFTTTLPNPGPHCYNSPGTYAISLIITGIDGSFTCTSSFTQTVTYTALAININPTPVCAGTPSTFSSTPSGFVTYTWNFGDGFTAYTPSSTHIYNSPGTGIPVSLTVVDQLGNTCIANASINVLPGVGPCTIQPAYICPGGTATLTVGSIIGATYLWEVETSLNVFAPAPGTNTNNTYVVTTPGFYRVIVTGPNGCKCTSNKVQVKAVPKPKAIIAASPSTKLCGPTLMTFVSSNHLPGYISNWYANGNYGSLLSSGPLFVTTVTATTTFNLVLTNEYGCTDTCSLLVTVNIPPAPPNISFSPTLCEGTPITLSVTNYTSNITWNTGATATSITAYVAGAYTATYTDPATGCSSSNTITVNRRPSTDLFPHFCNEIPCNCRDENGNVTIYAPKPLVGIFSVPYQIQWYFNNNPVGSNGNNPTYSPAAPGTYHIVVTDPITGCKDTSNKYTIKLEECCDCKDSKWGTIKLTEGDIPKPSLIEANIPSSGILKCNKNYTLLCNQPYTITANYICKDTTCTSKVTYSLQPPVGLPITGLVPFTFTPTQTGVYTLTLYGWCDGKICDSCVIDFNVNCQPECDCRRSRWGEKFYSHENVSKPFDCNKIYAVKCNKPVTVNANYICPDPACPPLVTYVLTPPVGASTTGNAPLTFIPSQTGTYTLTLYGMCGNKICDSCVVRFRTDCSCCPYTIKADTSKLTYSYNSAYNATVINQNLSISGLAGVPLTEVRAEVLSFTLTDNFGKECIRCQNFPYTWASILSANTISSPAVPPKITMFNSTVHPFNPTGTGVYQNPREVVWNNGGVFMLPNNSPMNLNFILPPPSAIDCCDLRGQICVKLTFRTDQCRECSVIVCFSYLIKSKKATPD